jgi:hypothetical protein
MPMHLIKAIILVVAVGCALIWILFGIIGALITWLYPNYDDPKPKPIGRRSFRRRPRAF